MRELDRFKANEENLSLYNQGMSLLFRSGVFDVLRAFARPSILGMGKDVQVMATQASRSSGFNECLDMLLYFKEVFIDQSTPAEKVPMDFGAGERNLKTGDISEEELNAIRTGEPINYAKYINPSKRSDKSKTNGPGSGLVEPTNGS